MTCVIQHILSREENWSVWKNDGCASYVREKAPVPSKTQTGRQVPQRAIWNVQ